MKQHTLLFAPFAIGALLIAGCSTPYNARSNEAPAQNESLYGGWPSLEAPNPPPPPPPEKNLTPRGFVPAKTGVPYEVSSGENPIYTVTFTEVTTDVQCTQDNPYLSNDLEKGNFLAVSMRVETAPSVPSYTSLPSPYNFTIYSPEGVVENTPMGLNSYSCLSESEMFPAGPVSPSSRYEGTVLIDTTNPTGVAAFRPNMYGSTGLELAY